MAPNAGEIPFTPAAPASRPGLQSTLPRVGPAPGWVFPYPCLADLTLAVEGELLVCVPQRGQVPSGRGGMWRGHPQDVLTILQAFG